jgi:glycine cleavage system aminomethyltransferase T
VSGFVLELTLLDAAIVACYAAATVLDAWSLPSDTFGARVARDELWVVGDRPRRCTLMRSVEQSLYPLAPDALLVDHTDGWTVWAIEGTMAPHALARLTVIPLDQRPGAFHQGAVAGVPAKVITTDTGYQVFVPAPVGHHLRDRVFEACADLTPKLGSPKPFNGRIR